MTASPAPTHVSQNRLEGTLNETPLPRLLDECRKQLVTGTIWVRTPGALGRVELRAGAVDTVEYGALREREALRAIEALPDGMYELVQRLPDLDGSLGQAAELRGMGVSLVKLMRHCEDNALSCTITVVGASDRGAIRYRAGEIVGVEWNGAADEDRIVDLVHLEDAMFRVTAPPLDLSIEGWPSVARQPTAPFYVDELGPRPRGRGTSPPTSPQAAPVPDPTSRVIVRVQPTSRWVWLAAGAGVAFVLLTTAFVVAQVLIDRGWL
jgi:hypothetical protein